jgi:expansin (peptidoglycan-binding protein)
MRRHAPARSVVAAIGLALLPLSLCGCGDQVGDCNAPEPSHTGEATYYTWADGTGACGFDRVNGEPLVAAMNQPDYAGSTACGACVQVSGPRGSVTLRIVDLCPECPQGNLDLSPQAFEHIADLPQGRVPIQWHYVPCDVQGPLRYHFMPESSRWWTALQIRNHRYRIRSVSWRTDSGTFLPLGREDYNYFVAPEGLGPGPYALRVEDIYGQVVVDEDVPLRTSADMESASQFPACAGQ